jgi:phage recombination protein Bet
METDFLTAEEIDLLKRTTLSAFSDDEKHSFIRICQRTRLDPFTKQIYATRRYQRTTDQDGYEKKIPVLVPVTGIMGLTAVAERTGDYDGCEICWSGEDGKWRSEWLSPEPPAAARCIVFHKKRTHPEIAIARWFSYAGQKWDPQKKVWVSTEFWARMPDFMLAKCAKAAALRGAFPDPLANVFIREELDSEITDTDHAETTLPRTPETKVHIVESTKPVTEDPEKAELQAERQREVAAGIADRSSPQQPESAESPFRGNDATPTPAQSPQATPEAGETVAAPAAWQDYIIASIKDDRFNGKKILELPPQLLAKIENQWMPAILKQWDDASDEQRADWKAFETAIAAMKMEKIT